MLRLGIISELGEDENIGFARVYFDESDLVSAWLPLPSTNTKTIKHWIPVEVNSQVACLMDEMCEQGCIVMVLWSDTDTPPDWATSDTLGVQFIDGSEVFYDSRKHVLNINAPDAELNLTCKKLNIEGEVNIMGETKIKGNASITGEIAAAGEVTSGMLKIPLTTHKHPVTSIGNPTGTPTP